MNVLIKRLAIGGVLYAVAEASFLMGKGFMLGILKGYDVSAFGHNYAGISTAYLKS